MLKKSTHLKTLALTIVAILITLMMAFPVMAQDKTSLYDQACSLINLKQYDTAKTVLRQYLLLDTLNANAYFALGFCDECRGKYHDALISYLNCLNLAKINCLDSSELRLNMGNCLFQLKNFPQARYNYERALDISPECNLARFNKARLDLFNNDYKSAYDNFCKCEQSQFNNEWLGYFEALCLFKLGFRQEANHKLLALNVNHNHELSAFSTKLLNIINNGSSQTTFIK